MVVCVCVLQFGAGAQKLWTTELDPQPCNNNDDDDDNDDDDNNNNKIILFYLIFEAKSY